MRLALWAVALIAVPGASATALHEGDSQPIPTRCAAPAFARFSARVWAPQRWQRGAPKKTTFAAQRRRLGCAGSDRAAMRNRWRRDRARYRRHRVFCYSGTQIDGLATFYSGGGTADGIHEASEPGIALRLSSFGQTFDVSLAGSRPVRLLHIDYGPAEWTGHAVDLTEAAVERFGPGLASRFHSAGVLPVVARQIPGACL